MSQVTPLFPQKNLQPLERVMLKTAAKEFALDRLAGVGALTCLMHMVVDWHSSRAEQGFTEYAQAWIAQGNIKGGKGVEALMRDLFGCHEPQPPKGAA